MDTEFQRTLADYLETLEAQRSRSLRTKIAAVTFLLIYIVGIIVLMSFGLTQGQAVI